MKTEIVSLVLGLAGISFPLIIKFIDYSFKNRDEKKKEILNSKKRLFFFLYHLRRICESYKYDFKEEFDHFIDEKKLKKLLNLNYIELKFSILLHLPIDIQNDLEYIEEKIKKVFEKIEDENYNLAFENPDDQYKQKEYDANKSSIIYHLAIELIKDINNLEKKLKN